MSPQKKSISPEAEHSRSSCALISMEAAEFYNAQKTQDYQVYGSQFNTSDSH